MKNRVTIDYFSDVLCVWAWIAERRIEELEQKFGSMIDLRLHYVDVFGDCAGKMQRQWAQRGAWEGFRDHVLAAARPYETAPVNPAVWQATRPCTSANAHLVLKAAELESSAAKARRLASRVREAFFTEARDIGQLAVLLAICEEMSLNCGAIRRALDDGSAIAALMADYQLAANSRIVGSPSWLLNDGRQTLYGNVGYRVISANVQELLANPTQDASWC
jgi:predicted DsbA family dithiol-disulfide isomerase